MSEAAELESLARSARSAATGCHWRGVGHTYSYRRWRAIGAVIGICAGALSAIAGSALLSGSEANESWRFAAGVLGIVAAVLIAIDRGLGASDAQAAHRSAALLWRGLAQEFFQFDPHQPDDAAEARLRLNELKQRRAQAEGSSEPLEKWAEEKADEGYQKAMAAKEAKDE